MNEDTYYFLLRLIADKDRETVKIKRKLTLKSRPNWHPIELQGRVRRENMTPEDFKEYGTAGVREQTWRKLRSYTRPHVWNIKDPFPIDPRKPMVRKYD